MSYESVLHGDPKVILEELLEIAWKLKDGVKNESGQEPHLYNKQNSSYYDSNIQREVDCIRIYSDQGWFHDCGISFHTYLLRNGQTQVWSRNGHDRLDSPEKWGTCSAMSELWYSCIAEVKARRH